MLVFLASVRRWMSIPSLMMAHRAMVVQVVLRLQVPVLLSPAVASWSLRLMLHVTTEEVVVSRVTMTIDWYKQGIVTRLVDFTSQRCTGGRELHICSFTFFRFWLWYSSEALRMERPHQRKKRISGWDGVYTACSCLTPRLYCTVLDR